MTGQWFISAGLNPLFDTFPCQVHFFDGFSKTEKEPGKLLGKINWRIPEPDGEYLTKSTIQKFVETSPGVLENHDNEYLHYQDDWYILDHAVEDDPELGFVLVYYRGRNDAWAGYGGGTLYTRSPRITQEILDRVCEACERVNLPFYKYWKLTDNTCPKVEDPSKLRSQYLEKLLEQGEISATEQLTQAARGAYSEFDKDERYVVDGARRIEKMTEDYLKTEINEVEKDFISIEKEFERDVPLLQLWFRQLFGSGAK